MTSHTPGPLKTWNEPKGTVTATIEGGPVLPHAVTAPSEMGTHEIVAAFKHQADADLFAAAPDLIEWLRVVVQDFEDSNDLAHFGDVFEGYKDAIEAAIAKATTQEATV